MREDLKNAKKSNQFSQEPYYHIIIIRTMNFHQFIIFPLISRILTNVGVDFHFCIELYVLA